MKILVRLLYLLILLAVLASGMIFTFRNTVEVPLDLFFVQLPAASLSFWILASFAIGGLLGMLFTLGVALKLKTGNVLLTRRLGKAASAQESQEARAS